MPAGKSLKNAPKISFWGFDKNPIHPYTLFSLEYESSNDLLTFCNNNMSVFRMEVQKLFSIKDLQNGLIF